MSDGGEGFTEVLAANWARDGGRWMTATVTGPLGSVVDARWWFAPPVAVIESAAASGLVLAGGPGANNPVAATSRGTGELLAESIRAGARKVLVGVGGSACTDGGLGALEAVEEAGGLDGAEVLVACDVDIGFVEAAARFGPQKGATPTQVEQLRLRLLELSAVYRERFGVDVVSIPRSGAAGGLAGGLAVLGASLVGGFELVAGTVEIDRRIASAALVVTGEGRLDSSSWSGKVVGGVLLRASSVGAAVLMVVGDLGTGALPVPGDATVELVSLTERFGRARALADPASCVAEAVRDYLDGL